MSPNRDHSTAPTAEGRPHVVTSGALPSPEAAEAPATLSQIWGAGQLDTAGGGEPPDQGLCPGEHESQGITWFCKKLLRSPLSLVSAPEEQPPRPETAGGLLERRRHLGNSANLLGANRVVIAHHCPGLDRPLTFRVKRLNPPCLTCSLGCGLNLQASRVPHNEVCCCGKTQGQSVTFLSILVKKVVHIMKILRNERPSYLYRNSESLPVGVFLACT